MVFGPRSGIFRLFVNAAGASRRRYNGIFRSIGNNTFFDCTSKKLYLVLVTLLVVASLMTRVDIADGEGFANNESINTSTQTAADPVPTGLSVSTDVNQAPAVITQNGDSNEKTDLDPTSDGQDASKNASGNQISWLAQRIPGMARLRAATEQKPVDGDVANATNSTGDSAASSAPVNDTSNNESPKQGDKTDANEVAQVADGNAQKVDSQAAEDKPTDSRAVPSARSNRTEDVAKPTEKAPSIEESFIATVADPARLSQAATGVPASVTIAQAMLESDLGRSLLSRQANNYFGIKGTTKAGPAGVVYMDTWESVNGKNITVKEPFRAYNNMLESFNDHGMFFIENSRYAAAMKNTGNAQAFAKLIQQAGYATDPKYADKLIALMDKFNLYAYDASS